MKRLVLAFALALAFAAPAHGQADNDTIVYSTRASTWLGQFTVLSANTLMSAVTAGLFQEIRGGSFKDGFTRGALGGAVIYTGKRVAAERFFGAGFIGREVSAVGASVVRNASDGIGTFDRLILPVGFTKVYWYRKQDRIPDNRVHVKFDVVSMAFTAYAVAEDELEFELTQTLSAGMPVFRTDNKLIGSEEKEIYAAGLQRTGIVLRSHVPAYREEFLNRVFAHERLHVLQDDQIFITLNDHADDWLLSKLGPIAPASRFIDLNGSTDLLILLANWIPKHGDRPWEMEPVYLTR